MPKEWQGLGYTKPVADAGFESEENYTWCEEHGQTAFIKPANYDTRKTRKYKSDIGRRENMPYDAKSDSYLCHMGKKIRSKAGYAIVTTVYTCTECTGCPHKAQCIKGASKKNGARTCMYPKPFSGSAKKCRSAFKARKVSCCA